MDPEMIERARAQEESRVMEEKQRGEILMRVCTPDALQRLGRAKLVRKEAVEKVEQLIVAQAKSGQIRAQLTENEIIGILERQVGGSHTATKISVVRKKQYGMDDEDDDDDDSDLL